MAELKNIIHQDSRSTTEGYIRWEYEDVAPSNTPKEKRAEELTQKDIDERTKDLLFNREEVKKTKDPLSTETVSIEDAIKEEYGPKTYTPKYTDEQLASKAKYTNTQYKNLQEQKQKSREKLRTDTLTYSTIKINKIDGSNDYADIQLINADRFQKVSDPTKWSVLTLYTGRGTDSQAVGIMVRRANIKKQPSKVDPKRNIFGTPEWTPEDKTRYNISKDSIGD